MVDIKCVWEEPAVLGEGPLWVARENAVYWVDIVSKNLHRYSLADDARRTWTFETEVTSLAARQQGGFVGTVRDGFAFIDLDTGAVEPIAMPEADITGNRFNDGKVDENGRYWAGSMDDGEKLETGSLYRLDGDLSLHKMDENYFITNGPAFSLDGKTLYVVQNFLNQIAVVHLTPDLSSGVVGSPITSPEFRIPTTAAEFGGALYAVNARFDAYDFNDPPTAVGVAFEVVRVPKS